MKMKRVAMIAVAAILAACGGQRGAHGELRDGAPMRRAPAVVRPGYAPAGAGLPEYLPGEPEPSYPRAPPGQRILPHTPQTRSEDTIWASDEPDADWSSSMWEILLPVPAPDNNENKAHSSRCGGTMRIASKWADMEERVDGLPTKEKQCLAALLYAYCIANDKALPTEKLGRFKAVADSFRRRACDEDIRIRMIPIFGPIAAKWHERYVLSTRGGQ